MAFSYTDAISRIDAQPEPIWTPGMTDAQKLQRINEALDLLWTVGSWEGLFEEVALTASEGIITLDPKYKTLEALSVTTDGRKVSIKSQQWKFSPSAPRVGDWTKYRGPLIAMDLGENDSGSRRYQIAGDPDYVDTLSLSGFAKFRYVYATSGDDDPAPNLSSQVKPDNFRALLMGVRSLHWYDVGDTSRGEEEFGTAIKLLEAGLEDVIGDEDLGRITVDPQTSGGSIFNLV